ncbi:MAG: DeoR/GlpR transcriptional regulator [Verrucomicrobia bacterium]|nr:MAG: DeoR/GlpR transcriptional regulator [Verrucomicrobiota bacterium]TAE86175.1 MAG: DeoR/GlpR transcriptional regulator [Verrucomicrobiota bacterium]TAF23522.1 MAG: DeoR/GlpR transcriptional regulator [Verrucomicrobiota bacterium]
MLAAERQRQILDRVRHDGTVRTADLARDFAVTEETIRRDLDYLGRRGHLRRTHGGAMDVTMPLGELSQSEREARHLEEKVAIARETSRLLAPGETILLDASTTALELAGQLPAGMPLRVVTYSLAVVERLAANDDVELVQLGGRYEPRGRRFSGMLTESALRLLKIDRFFFSGAGLDPAQGVGEPNHEQARLKRQMVEHAAWNCALIDHSKLGVKADHFFATPADLDVVITDRDSKSYIKSHLKNPPYELRFAR